MAWWHRGWLGRLGRSCLALCLIPSAPAMTAATLAPVPTVHEVDWRTSPLDLNLRGFNGERFCLRCPAGKTAPGQVIGSGPIYRRFLDLRSRGACRGDPRRKRGARDHRDTPRGGALPRISQSLRAERGLRQVLERQLPGYPAGPCRFTARTHAPGSKSAQTLTPGTFQSMPSLTNTARR